MTKKKNATAASSKTTSKTKTPHAATPKDADPSARLLDDQFESECTAMNEFCVLGSKWIATVATWTEMVRAAENFEATTNPPTWPSLFVDYDTLTTWLAPLLRNDPRLRGFLISAPLAAARGFSIGALETVKQLGAQIANANEAATFLGQLIDTMPPRRGAVAH